MPATDESTCLVSLEFTGIAPEYGSGKILTGGADERVLVVDPLSVPASQRDSIGTRAQAIADRVTAAGIRRVVLMASCTGAALLDEVARKLESAGVVTASMAAVDPVRVTWDILTLELGMIANRIGVDRPAGSFPERCNRDADVMSGITDLLRSWAERHISAFITNPDERNLILEELLERYLNWMSYLVSALDKMRIDYTSPLHVFGDEARMSREAGYELGARTVQHYYQVPGEPCVTDMKCTADIRDWWACLR